MIMCQHLFSLFFFNDTATTEIYTLSLHDALPICKYRKTLPNRVACTKRCRVDRDRKSTRLNSSHQIISYAVFCLKKKTHIKGGAKKVIIPAPPKKSAKGAHDA